MRVVLFCDPEWVEWWQECLTVRFGGAFGLRCE